MIRRTIFLFISIVCFERIFSESCTCNPIIQIATQSKGKHDRFVSITTQMQLDQIKQVFENASNTLLDNKKDRFRNFLNLLHFETRPTDCQDVRSMGHATNSVHKIYPTGTNGINVYCDQTTDGGGWTVFQRRVNGSVNFHRNWFDYQIGFGSLNGEFWLGNQQIHLISSQGWYELRIDLTYPNSRKWYAKYNVFRVADLNDKYRLLLDGYSGNTTDSMKHHFGRRFSTHDQDNDDYSENCAARYTGGWWYGACRDANLNGQFRRSSFWNGIVWYYLSSTENPIFTEMKMRRLGN